MQFFPIKKSAHGGISLFLTTISSFCSIFSNNNTPFESREFDKYKLPKSQNFMKTLPLKAENLMNLKPHKYKYLVGTPNWVLDGFVRRRVLRRT